MINSIGIHVKVKDFGLSYRFYKDLGFEKVFEYGPRKKVKEEYSGVVFEHNGTRLEIADGHRAVKHKVFEERISSPKVSLMIQVVSLSKLISRLNRKGIPVAVGPRHYYWGTLELVIEDPDGLILVFIAPYSQNEARKIKADESFAGQ